MQISHRNPIADTQRGSVLGYNTQNFAIDEATEGENDDDVVLLQDSTNNKPYDFMKLDPFCLTERRLNRSLEKQLVFPRNPTDNVQKVAG